MHFVRAALSHVARLVDEHGEEMLAVRALAMGVNVDWLARQYLDLSLLNQQDTTGARRGEDEAA